MEKVVKDMDEYSYYIRHADTPVNADSSILGSSKTSFDDMPNGQFTMRLFRVRKDATYTQKVESKHVRITDHGTDLNALIDTSQSYGSQADIFYHNDYNRKWHSSAFYKTALTGGCFTYISPEEMFLLTL